MDGLLVPVSGIVFKYLILCNERSVIFPIISQALSLTQCAIYLIFFLKAPIHTQLSHWAKNPLTLSYI